VRVILLDGPVDPEHPDISAALVADMRVGPELPLPHPDGEPKKQHVRLRSFAMTDHATHLAGIVASRRNGYGVMGVNPTALVEPIDWTSFDNRELSGLVGLLEARRKHALRDLPLILFASQWTLMLASHKTEVSSRDDVKDDVLARYLLQAQPVMVAAAGQYDRTTRPQVDDPNGSDLATKPRRAPAALAGFPAVVLVTTCVDCYSPTARIADGANYSRDIVHLAAPATRVFSSLRNSYFGVAGGTSQAAALAAGVASAMVTTYDYYTDASKVKRRLQVTSWPITDSSKPIATGAVDMRAALLNPKKHYRIAESDSATGEDSPYEEFFPVAWCGDTLRLETANGLETVPSANVRRIVRRSEEEWIAYVANRSEFLAGTVRRLGPGKLAGQPCLVLSDGRVRRVGDFQDIILADNDPLRVKS
jgi:hypothetical protein